MSLSKTFFNQMYARYEYYVYCLCFYTYILCRLTNFIRNFTSHYDVIHPLSKQFAQAELKLVMSIDQTNAKRRFLNHSHKSLV